MPRLGKRRAAMAIAHKIFVGAYDVLAGALDFADLGAAYLDRREACSSSHAGPIRR